MVSKETLEKIDHLIEKYLPSWFKEEFHERIHRLEIRNDIDLIKEFLKLIYLRFIQPAQFIDQTLKNLCEIDRDIANGKIELPEGPILIGQDRSILFGKDVHHSDIRSLISDFEKLLVELRLEKDFTRFGKW